MGSARVPQQLFLGPHMVLEAGEHREQKDKVLVSWTSY